MNKKRLKIGLFLDSFFPNIDGVVNVVDNLAKELSKYNDVVVVVPYTESVSEDKDRPYKVVRINSLPVPFTDYRVSLMQTRINESYKILLEEKFDIIHIHSPLAIGSLGLKVAKKLNIPCLATMHTRFDFEIRKRVNNQFIIDNIISRFIKIYNSCDKCIAVNNAMKKVFKDYGYLYEPVVIYNGTDLTTCKDKEIINKINVKYSLDEVYPVFLFVGRIIDIKNIFFILDSLKLLKEEGYKFKMIYVGDGFDLKELQKRIVDYGMQDYCITTGMVTDRNIISGFYKRADLFLFPSLFDASSLVQIEAAVNETPGVFIEGSVTSDTVINNVSGFTSSYNVNDYKERIKEIISDKEKLKEVGKNAREMLGRSWDGIAKDTYELYLKEIEKKEL